MFAIIISEKGGAERRESFDKTEINVGRVQGNDLMLPKGNVSKRHARLLYRDGRFIVTDLKSTNGTYVNGRKIAQATIVREGDKIYIGDFVLRIELAGGEASADAPPPAPPQEEASADEAAANGPGQQNFARPQAPPPQQAPPPPLPGAPTAGPPPGGMGMPVIPQPPLAPQMPRQEQSSPNLMGGPSAPQGPGGAPNVGGAQAPSRETALGPGPRAPGAFGGPPAPAASGPAAAPKNEPGFGPPQPPPQPPPQMAPPQMAPPPMVQPPMGAPPPQAPPGGPPAMGMGPGFGPPAGPPPMQHGPGAMGPNHAAFSAEMAQPPPIPPGFVPQPPPPVAPSAPPPPMDAPPAYGAPLQPPAPLQPRPADGGPPPAPVPANQGPPPPLVQPSPPSVAPAPPAKVAAPPPVAPVPPAEPKPAPPAPVAPAAVAPVAPASIPASSQPAQSPRSSVRSAAASEGVVEPSQAAAHRTALQHLMDRVNQSVDVSALASGDPPTPALSAAVERALTEHANAIRGELPPGVDVEVIVAEARRELFDLGPVGPLLDDEYAEEVQLIRHDHVVAMHGKKQVATEIAFTSEAAVARLVRRICVRSGRPLQAGELFVERRLDRGARMFGVLPPASGEGHMLIFRKPQRALATLEELVKSGTVARQMATLLAQAVQGRANILVTGSVGAGATTLLGALAGAGNLEDRVVVLEEDEELVLNQPHTVSMLLGDTAAEGARAVHAAIRVRPDRLVVGAFAGHVVPEIVDAIGDGLDGVLAAARAPTLRHLVARLPADIAATRKLLGLDTAREWLASSFDLVLEVARLRDGRNRVMRVAEFTLAESSPLELRDIFTFTVERTAAGGTVEGSFHPTGAVPRIAEDLVARGVPLDLGIFKRTTR